MRLGAISISWLHSRNSLRSSTPIIIWAWPDALEKLFGRPADLVTESSIRNPHFEKASYPVVNFSMIIATFFRRAVEREFEIIGEALSRLVRLDPLMEKRIPELRPTISFRNRIIHGYDTVDDAVVWGVVEKHLPLLIAEVVALLEEGEGAPCKK